MGEDVIKMLQDNHANAKVAEYNAYINKNVGSEEYKTEKKQKKISRKEFIKLFLATIAGACAALMGEKIVQIGSRVSDLNNAIKYMNDVKFKEYFERLEILYKTEKFLIFKKLDINDNNINIMRTLLKYLQDDGFKETEAWYAINASMGLNGLNLVAKVYNKDSIEDFLIYYGYFNKREDGTKKASIVLLENLCEEGYVNNVADLQRKQETEEKGKGL